MNAIWPSRKLTKLMHGRVLPVGMKGAVVSWNYLKHVVPAQTGTQPAQDFSKYDGLDSSLRWNDGLPCPPSCNILHLSFRTRFYRVRNLLLSCKSRFLSSFEMTLAFFLKVVPRGRGRYFLKTKNATTTLFPCDSDLRHPNCSRSYRESNPRNRSLGAHIGASPGSCVSRPKSAGHCLGK